MKIVNESVELLQITPHTEKFIEKAARTCYKSEDHITDDSAAKLVKRLLDSGHHSALEHASATFRIVCDRGISHEIVRHRLVSYSQESTRYCNYSKEKFDGHINIIIPPDINLPKTLKLDDMTKKDFDIIYEKENINIPEFAWLKAVLQAEQSYLAMVNAGVSPQIARSVLPNALKTEIIMTANFREWMHFITLRSSKRAHPQIRPIAKAICRVLMFASETMFEPLWSNIDTKIKSCLIMNTDSSVFTEGVKDV